MLLEPAGPLPVGPVTVHSPIQKSNRCRSGASAHGVGARAGADAAVGVTLCAPRLCERTNDEPTTNVRTHTNRPLMEARFSSAIALGRSSGMSIHPGRSERD